MFKVITYGSLIAVFCFSLVGFFGYATFVQDQGQLCTKNILEAESYNQSKIMQVAHFALLFSVIASIPIAMIPSKDSIEELVFKEKGMNKSQNVLITFLLITMNCCMALFVPDIGSAITLVGSTINPIIGFILPVVLYWPYIKR